MIQGLLWIVGSYGLCIVIVHLTHSRSHDETMKSLHYVLITHNNQQQVEWCIRSLLLSSWIRGKAVKLTILDQGSVDDTLAIVRRISMDRYLDINMIPSPVPASTADSQHEEAGRMDTSATPRAIVCIQLNSQDDLQKIPQFVSR